MTATERTQPTAKATERALVGRSSTSPACYALMHAEHLATGDGGRAPYGAG